MKHTGPTSGIWWAAESAFVIRLRGMADTGIVAQTSALSDVVNAQADAQRSE